jgi:hypothetical protein
MLAGMELLKAQKVNIICPEGDILLRGAHKGSNDLLLVSSQVLSKASASFSKLLQTRTLPTSQSFAFTNEVKLPDDDGDALLTICNILHGRSRQVPDSLPLEGLKEIARSCNRHQLTDVLLPWSPKWLDHAFSVAVEKELYTVFAIAVDLGVPSIFDDSAQYRSSKLSRIQDLAGGYHYQKTQVMLKAVAALRNCSLDMYYLSPNCTEGHPAFWKAQLESRGLWPFEHAIYNCDLSGLLDSLKTLDIPGCVTDCGCRGFTSRLPQDLCNVVCRTLESVCTVRPLKNAYTHAERQ